MTNASPVRLYLSDALTDVDGLIQVISFLRKKEGFIGLVLNHIDASAMMDLLLRLISCVEPAPLRQEVLVVSTVTCSLALFITHSLTLSLMDLVCLLSPSG